MKNRTYIRSGNTVVAQEYINGSYISAKAVCGRDDEFNLATGIVLADKRLDLAILVAESEWIQMQNRKAYALINENKNRLAELETSIEIQTVIVEIMKLLS